jgi:hypothetical protein
MRTFVHDQLDFGKYLAAATHLEEQFDDINEDDMSRMVLGIAPILTLGLKLEGLRVLDIGCGSEDNALNEEDPYPPVVCRVLKRLGAHPIGIDICSNRSEEFEHYQVNLWKPDSLNMISSNSIDVALAIGVTDSPTLDYSRPRRKPLPYNDLTRRFLDHVTPQLERIVKADGYFVFTDPHEYGDDR